MVTHHIMVGKHDDSEPSSSHQAASAAKTTEVSPRDVEAGTDADDNNKKQGALNGFFPDLVEDAVRLRWLSVAVITTLYIVLAFTAVALTGKLRTRPDKVAVTSKFTESFVLNKNLSVVRAPRLRVVSEDDVSFSKTNVKVQVSGVFQKDPRKLQCSTDMLTNPTFIDTLEHTRIKEACEVKLSGHEVSTDVYGVASLDTMTVERGPPGLYVFNASSDDDEDGRQIALDEKEAQRTNVVGSVFEIQIETRIPLNITARQPLPTAPVLRLFDLTGVPVENVQCVAFSFTEPNFHDAMSGVLLPPDQPGTFRPSGEAKSNEAPFSLTHIRGQRLAVLEGEVSTASDGNGRASFPDLRVVGSTSQTIFLCFTCQGVVVCWSSPFDVGGTTQPKGPRYLPAISLTTSTVDVQLADKVDTTRIQQVVEGVPLPQQPAVRIVDRDGKGVPGVVAVAVLVKQDGAQAPLFLMRKGAKTMARVLSKPSDASGIARFEDLHFQVSGDLKESTGTFAFTVCADGICLPEEDDLVFDVSTSIKSMIVSRYPRFIRLNSTEAFGDFAQPGETAKQANAPPAVVRFLDDKNAPIPGKAVERVAAVRLSTPAILSDAFDGLSMEDTLRLLESAMDSVFLTLGVPGLSDVERQMGTSAGGKDAVFAYAAQRVSERLSNPSLDKTVLPATGEKYSGVHLEVVDDPDARISGIDGFAGTHVHFTSASEFEMNLAMLGLVGLSFETDGVRSPPSGPVYFGMQSAKLAEGKCARLVIKTPPPKEAYVNRPFGWTPENENFRQKYKSEPAMLQAVDSLGNPVPDVIVVPVSVEDFTTRAPPMYKMSADYLATDEDGNTRRERNAAFRAISYTIREDLVDGEMISRLKGDIGPDDFPSFFFMEGPRAEIVSRGPTGTMRMQYVAIRKPSANMADVRKIIELMKNTEERILNDTNFDFDLETELDNKITRISQATITDIYDAAGENDFYLDLCQGEDGVACEVECVSDTFDVSVHNDIDSINIIDVGVGGTEITSTKFDIDITPDRFIVRSWLQEYDPTFLMQGENLFTTKWRTDIKVSVSNNENSGVKGRTLDIELVSAPPIVYFQAQREKITCPSAKHTYCYLNITSGKLHYSLTKDEFDFAKEQVRNEEPYVPLILFSDHFSLTAFGFSHVYDRHEYDRVDGSNIFNAAVIFFQNVTGTDSSGESEVSAVFGESSAGEYSFVLGRSGTYSRPVTISVRSRLAKIEIISEPTEELKDLYYVGDGIPMPEARLLQEDGSPLQNYRVAAEFVEQDENGNWIRAPVLLDFGEKSYDVIAGAQYSVPSDKDGFASFFLDGYGTATTVMDAKDGCYAMRLIFANCGDPFSGRDDCAATEASGLSPSPYVTSEVTKSKWCFSSAGVEYKLTGKISPATVPGVYIPDPPTLSITVSRNAKIFEELNSQFAYVVPHTLKQDENILSGVTESLLNYDIVLSKAGIAKAVTDTASAMIAAALTEDVVPPAYRVKMAYKQFTGNLCVFQSFKPVWGPCTQPMKRTVVGKVGSRAEYRYDMKLDRFSWREGLDGSLMQLAPARPLAVYFPDDEDVTGLPQGATASGKIQLRSEPQAIYITMQPPQKMEVGELFEVRAQVTISSGAPVPFATVYAHIVKSKGSVTETAGEFLDRIFGSQNSSDITYGLPPKLDVSRSVVRADRNGVARMKLRVEYGISGNYALYFTSGRAKSEKTTPIALINPVSRVDIVELQAVSKSVDGKYGLPAAINLKRVVVKVVGADGVTGVTPEMQELSFETSMFRVNEYSKRNTTKDVEQLRSGGGSGVARARALYSLLTEGAKRLSPSQKKTRDAIFGFKGPTPVHLGGGEYEFVGASVLAFKKGKYRVQFIVQGIATPPSLDKHDVNFKTHSKTVALRLKWGNTIATLVLVVLCFSGNSANTPRWRILLTIAACAATIALVPLLGRLQSDLWWIMVFASVGVTALFAFLALTMSFVDRGRFATHAAKREASMMAYVRRLWNEPLEEDDELNSLSSSATEALTSHLRQIKISLRDLFASMVTNHSRDAFYYPAKVIAAFVVSQIVVLLMLVSVLNSGTKIANYVESLSYKTVATIFTYTVQIEEQYFSRQLSDLPSFYERWAYTQAHSVSDAFHEFALTVNDWFKVGVSVGYLVFFVAWVVFLADFRRMVMCARRGKFHFTYDKLQAFHSADYLGVHTSSSVVTFVLVSVVVALVGTIIAWKVSRSIIWETIVEFWPLIMSMGLSIGINVGVKFAMAMTASRGNTIQNRNIWGAFEAFMLLTNLLVGLVKGIMRWLMSSILSLLALARVERDVIPGWIAALVPALDPVSSRVFAYVYLVHQHNAPVMRVAAWLLLDAGQTWKSRNGGKSGVGMHGTTLSNSAARVRTKFQVALLLTKNPKLREFRKSALKGDENVSANSKVADTKNSHPILSPKRASGPVSECVVD